MSKIVSAVLSLLLLAAVAAQAVEKDQQVYLEKDLIVWDRQDVGGGKGKLAGRFAYTRNDASVDYVLKEIGWMTLQPGESIGLHKHVDNEDTYIIISGEGTFTDTNGKTTKVKKGDVTIARPGQSHALANTGKKPLVFLDIIGKNSGK
ncbi:MAG: cupin domain-containing protein [Elusimicrobiota bacterium]|jgi:mannose-6-phosphate isomerase-like protein (cupin superfamily)|nr:cupin domain-containing protein [Elusimicrobiota bacterium]